MLNYILPFILAISSISLDMGDFPNIVKSADNYIEKQQEKLKPKPTPSNITDNKEREWWFRRNSNHTPPTAQSEIDLSEYDAYYLGDTDSNVIYLTFDEGYENGYTPAILDVLQENDVKATFFVTKPFITSNPDLCKRMADEGHKVGNHTATHRSMPTLSEEQMKSEISLTEQAYEEATGYEMDKFFRPPSGKYSRKSLYVTMSMGYKSFFWSFAHEDWDPQKQPSIKKTYDMMTVGSHPGAVYLIHAVSKSNTEALDSVIKELKSQGYEFSTLDDFL